MSRSATSFPIVKLLLPQAKTRTFSRTCFACLRILPVCCLVHGSYAGVHSTSSSLITLTAWLAIFTQESTMQLCGMIVRGAYAQHALVWLYICFSCWIRIGGAYVMVQGLQRSYAVISKSGVAFSSEDKAQAGSANLRDATAPGRLMAASWNYIRFTMLISTTLGPRNGLRGFGLESSVRGSSGGEDRRAKRRNEGYPPMTQPSTELLFPIMLSEIMNFRWLILRYVGCCIQRPNSSADVGCSGVSVVDE